MSVLVSTLLLAVPASGAAVGHSAVSSSAPRIPRELERAAPVTCSAHKAVRFYARRLNEHRAQMGMPRAEVGRATVSRCPRYLAHVLQRKARAWRLRAEAWARYHYDWQTWLPDKWQRVGACETGYGRRPGQWTWNSGTYQGAFGFYHGSWDAFVPRADRKAGPYPSEAYNATPRQQYEVALAIWRAYGFSGWGCRGA